VAEDLGGGSGAQQVGIVDAVLPATSVWIRVSPLRPGRWAPGRPPRSTSSSMTASRRSRSARVAGNSCPALATAWSSSKPTTGVLGLWEDGIEKVPS
jgi:hypothetical protein